MFQGETTSTHYQWQKSLQVKLFLLTLAEPELDVEQYFFIVTDNSGCSVVTFVEINEFSGEIDLIVEDESSAQEPLTDSF